MLNEFLKEYLMEQLEQYLTDSKIELTPEQKSQAFNLFESKINKTINESVKNAVNTIVRLSKMVKWKEVPIQNKLPDECITMIKNILSNKPFDDVPYVVVEKKGTEMSFRYLKNNDIRDITIEDNRDDYDDTIMVFYNSILEK